jgi:hypothetical protein
MLASTVVICIVSITDRAKKTRGYPFPVKVLALTDDLG